jgi:hypothetical protein
MISYYDIETRPQFEYGNIVKVDFKKLCDNNCGIIEGKIVGRTLDDVSERWLVKFSRDFAPESPYKVVSIPTNCIVMGFEYQ